MRQSLREGKANPAIRGEEFRPETKKLTFRREAIAFRRRIHRMELQGTALRSKKVKVEFGDWSRKQ